MSISNRLTRFLGVAALAAVTVIPAIPASAQHRDGGSQYRHRSGGSRHGYRPHRTYRSYRYYRPYWSLGWGWGWPYHYGHWGPWGGGVYIYDGRPYRSGRYAMLDTDISPEEAEIYLNGQYIGTADDFDGYPDFLYLEPGKYQLELKSAGHKPMSLDLSVRRGQMLRLDRTLARDEGRSKLDFDSQGKTGTPYGRVFGSEGKPVTRDTEPEPEEVEAYGEGDEGEDAEEPMERREQPRRDLRLDRDRDRDRDWDRDRDRDRDRETRSSDRSRLKFNVEPDDAAVYLDDKYLGAAEELEGRGLVAEPGKHTVTVVRPGYQTKSVDVELETGKTIDVAVELEK